MDMRRSTSFVLGDLRPVEPAEVEVGRIYDGTVLRLLDFGAIVQILPGKDGLLHISQIAKERVNQVSDYVKEGQVVTPSQPLLAIS